MLKLLHQLWLMERVSHWGKWELEKVSCTLRQEGEEQSEGDEGGGGAEGKNGRGVQTEREREMESKWEGRQEKKGKR